MEIKSAIAVLEDVVSQNELLPTLNNAILTALKELNKKKYTKVQYLYAAKLGDVSMVDALHVTSLLDEAVKYENK